MQTIVAPNNPTLGQAGAAAPARRPLIVSGYWVSQMISVAANLGLADLIDDAPKTADELAVLTHAHAPSLHRLLRALVGGGLLTQLADGRFGLTPVGEQLRTTDARSQRSLATLLGEEHYRAWGQLYDTVMTGNTAFDSVFGCSLFEYLEKTPRMAELFHAAMGEVVALIAPAVLRAYDFSDVSTLVDVGGGAGVLLSAILTAHPRIHGIVYDSQAAVARAIRQLRNADLSARGQAVEGNFFESVPGGADAYILRGVIHDWDDDRALVILGNCRQAMNGRGRLLLVEHVVPDGPEPSFSKLQDLDMLVMTGGRERSEAEYRALLASAGFRLARIVPTSAVVSVLEGFPI